MARIIITGTPEENKKTLAAIKGQFCSIEKRSDFISRGEQTTIAEVYLDHLGKDTYSEEEILKALDCCAKKDKLCIICPYKKEPKCNEKMMLDAAVLVNRMSNSHKGVAVNDNE